MRVDICLPEAWGTGWGGTGPVRRASRQPAPPYVPWMSGCCWPRWWCHRSAGGTSVHSCASGLCPRGPVTGNTASPSCLKSNGGVFITNNSMRWSLNEKIKKLAQNEEASKSHLNSLKHTGSWDLRPFDLQSLNTSSQDCTVAQPGMQPDKFCVWIVGVQLNARPTQHDYKLVFLVRSGLFLGIKRVSYIYTELTCWWESPSQMWGFAALLCHI